MTDTQTTVNDVRNFWESNPLWSGESSNEIGSQAYFDEHRSVVINDCLGGDFDFRTMPDKDHRNHVLDLGCGPGFWTIELGKLGCTNLVAADLTEEAIRLAKVRCDSYGVAATFSRENAESLSFANQTFSHVNCQGVIHHTPDTAACVREIARVLKPGGTASISVYYKNLVLKAWPALHWVGAGLHRLGAKLPGRGRENIFLEENVDEIVRLYDGFDNPIGKSYSKKDALNLVEPYFDVDQTYLHFFPARSLPVKIPRQIHKALDSKLGFMIYINLRKKITD